jgi:hypothetical protein
MMRNDLFGFGGKNRQSTNRVPRILLYESEARRIARYTQSSERIEIGGDLFGFYEPGGSPMIFIASGPGPAARRDVTHFQQDAEFQVRIFNQLASQYRMFYLGDWHSHHNLGLSEPSGSDDAKLQDLAAKNGWPQLFSLIVQTEGVRGKPSHLGARSSMVDRNIASGPTEAFGIWWNAFHYAYLDQEFIRQRVWIDIQPEETPFYKTAEEINVSSPTVAHSSTFERQRMSSFFNIPQSDLSSGSPKSSGEFEFLIGLYQSVCNILADEIRSAEMEVDLEHSEGPRLIAMNDGRQVVCQARIIDGASLQIDVKSGGISDDRFVVPHARGRLKPGDLKLVAKHVIEHLVHQKEGDKGTRGRRR